MGWENDRTDPSEDGQDNIREEVKSSTLTTHSPWSLSALTGTYEQVPSREHVRVRWRLALIGLFIFASLVSFSWIRGWLDQSLVGRLNLLGYLLCIVLWFQASMKAVAALWPLPKVTLTHAVNSDPGPWPHYTVLVPIYDEGPDVVSSLMQNLGQIDYPRERLQILMICETDDYRTIAAVKARLTPPFELVDIPEGGPRTKPKALRVAMRRARGQLVTIYDAEDAPHPQQLKAAARAFAADPTLAAVQAPLTVDNAAPGWIPRQFALEYAQLFYIWVPWLARMKLPSPLGGTSNHIRRDALETLGGWDAFNVTEDADLTFRLAMSDSKATRIGWIAPPTREEAVATIAQWKNQRTRWMKGFLQTWLSHMRAPFAPGGWQGVIRFFTLQLTLGLTLLTSLFHLPTILIVIALWIAGQPPSPAITATGGAIYLSGLIITMIGARRAGIRYRVMDIVTIPAYWMLMTWPAWLAVRDLILRPNYWNKTPHGVSARRPQTSSLGQPLPTTLADTEPAPCPPSPVLSPPEP